MKNNFKTKILFILILFFGIFGVAKSSWAACSSCDTTIASCTAGTTVAQINTCLGSLPDGGTINFGAGSYTWNGTIIVSSTKGVNFIGSTSSATGGDGTRTVNMTGGTIHTEGITSSTLYRFSGFTFSGVPSGSIFFNLSSLEGYTLNLRVDHNTFSDLSTGGSGIMAIRVGSYSPDGGPTKGVADHNSVTGFYNFVFVFVFGVGANVAAPPSPKGTDNNFFIEDNIVNFPNITDFGTCLIDGWNAASIVARHNTITNGTIAGHEEGHHGGILNYEIYNNTLIKSGTGGYDDGTWLIHHQGSGENLFFNNVFTPKTGHSTDAIGLTDYRSCPQAQTGSGMAECDGNQTIDGNFSGQYGYPCWRQSGRMNAGAITTNGQPGDLSPVYVWNNYWSDTLAKINVNIDNPWGCSNPSPSTHLVSDRDYYNAVSALTQTSPTSPFNGTTGMGFGILANRPTTCTTNPLESGGGVGYFATDQGPQGTLYRCSATNTWTVQYTPYTYPHPLVSVIIPPSDTTPPAAPSGLAVQ